MITREEVQEIARESFTRLLNRYLQKVSATPPADGQALIWEADRGVYTPATPTGSGAPADATYLVLSSNATLTAEEVVGATPGGELGGTWASPTVDATHSGSTHSAATDTHIADATDAHDASAISILDTAGDFTATDVEGALAELQSDAETHAAAADPHTGYRLESADHTHQSTGLQGGILYAYKTYVFHPSVAIDEDIVAGDRQDWHHSGPLDETVISIISDFITAPGTNIIFELEFASSNTFDGSPTWTEIDSITHASGDGITLETTSGFTNSTITANRIIRFNVASTSGTAPQNGKITLRTRSLIPIA